MPAGLPAITLVMALMVAALPLAAAQAPIEDIENAALFEGGSTPTHDIQDRMAVSVTIGGAGPYPFIVDTAAERSVISRELAQQLNLEPAGSARLLSLADSREVERVHLRDLSFLPGATHDLRAFALSGDHIGAAGVLGIDVLRDHRVVLDFHARTMSLTPAPHAREQTIDPDAIVVVGRRRLGQLVLAQSTLDGFDVDVIVDTGLQVSVGNEALRRLLRSRTDSARFRPITMQSVTGESLQADYAIVDNFRIANMRLSNLPIAFADAYVFRRLRMTRQPVLLLGMDALRLFERVAVDFPNRRAYFVLPDR